MSRPRNVRNLRRDLSSGLAMIIAEHSSESLTPFDIHTALEIRGDGLQQSVVGPLMVAFTVIVRHEVGDRVLK